MNHVLHVLCITVLLLFGVSVSKPKEIVAHYDAEGVERIKAEWMQSPLWMKDYRILLNAIQSLQNDNNMLRRNLLNEGEIGTDASFKPRRLAAAEESIFEELTNEEFEQWIDIMSRIKWTSLNAGDRRRLSEKLEHKKVRIQPVNPGAPLTRYGWIMKVEYGATNEPKELEIFEPVMNGELSAGATEVFSTRRDWDPNPEEINPQYLRTYTWSGHRWVTWVDSATEQKCMIKVVEDEADQPEPLQGGEK